MQYCSWLYHCSSPKLTDITTPDLYTNEQTMAWIYDTFNTFDHNASMQKEKDKSVCLHSLSSEKKSIKYTLENE